MINRKKIIVLAAIMVVIAGLFWSQSRLPALDEKSQMGQRTNISAIAFDVIYPVSQEQPFLERVVKTSVNWGYTNWKGMAFGILFGAAFLSFLQSLPPKAGTKNRFLNSIKGLIGGVPLSVCVNCATPIAQGMHHMGVRHETVLATLMSSPTLNIIVLTMAFSLMPFYFAAIKVIGSVIFIIFLIPLLVKLTEKYSHSTNHEENLSGVWGSRWFGTSRFSEKDTVCEVSQVSESWVLALSDGSATFLKNLFFIIKIALPLMALAGILGAMVIEAVPFGKLAGLTMGWASLLVISLVGTFLPVPIAFDVIITTALLSSGFPAGLSMALMFSLGIFSIYPAMVVARSISFRLSCSIFMSVVVYAIFIGGITQFTRDNIKMADTASITQELQQESEQNRKELFARAKTECQAVFNKIKNQSACINSILSSGLLGDIDRATCDEFLESGGVSHQSCVGGVELSEVVEIALKTKKSDSCQAIKNNRLQQQCKIRLIKTQSFNPLVLNLCGQLKGEEYKAQCRIEVITSRIASYRNLEACNLRLSKSERTSCVSALQAMNLSEHGDLDLCFQIKNSGDREICLLNVITRKINNKRDYSVCKKVPALIKKDCMDLVHAAKAEVYGDPEHCRGIVNAKLTQDQPCRINAVIRKLQMEMSNQQFLFSRKENNSLMDSEAITEIGKEKINSKKVKRLTQIEHYKSDKVSISFVEHFKRPGTSLARFKKVVGAKVGLNNPLNFNLMEFTEPFLFGRGIASGDFNNDGWPDLVFPSNTGAYLYQNNGDGTYSINAKIDINHLLNGLVVAFVDINNDGWQDLFYSTYGGDNYFFINDRGNFEADNRVLLPDKNRVITMAAGFADWNKDGDLDFIFGNWSTGTERDFLTEFSQNQWFENFNMKFKMTPASDLSGETLSVLLSDVNGDRNIDMLIGNDREIPDFFYYGSKEGRFSAVLPEQGIFPETSLNTMGYESADFNNDLMLDIFSTDMSFDQRGKTTYCPFLSTEKDRKQCDWFLEGYRALQRYNISWCNNPAFKSMKKECLSAMALRIAIRDHNSQLCDKIPKPYQIQKKLCQNLSRKITKNPDIPFSEQHRQRISNKLLINTKEGIFLDKTEEMNVGRSYWSWNAKAADLDNDEWQDIFVVNGFKFGKNKKVHTNIFFHNQKGESFERAESEFGLENNINTPSYTYSDIDLDGDIDIITNGVMEGPTLYLNQNSSNNSISFALRDLVGNHFCIGCKVIIHYDQHQKSQIRELKLSGGFISFDDPVVYFGLGSNSEINGFEVIWSTGESLELDKPLLANHRYTITRLKK